MCSQTGRAISWLMAMSLETRVLRARATDSEAALGAPDTAAYLTSVPQQQAVVFLMAAIEQKSRLSPDLPLLLRTAVRDRLSFNLVRSTELMHRDACKST
jgi:hypothetical protein